MGTTEPIRDEDKLQLFIRYYKEIHPNQRNYTLICMGLNTAMRISDILSLRWMQVYDFEKMSFRSHVYVTEQKTGKHNTVLLNNHILHALTEYFKERSPKPEDYIFSTSKNPHAPISRVQAYRLVKTIASYMNEDHISCHSMRKTFGYHAWKQGTPPALLMDIYNHSSYQITKHYLGIGQDERDSIFLKINFEKN